MSGFTKCMAFVVCLQSSYACTNMIAGKGATLDGSILSAGSDDSEGNDDFRLVKVPARDPKETMRPIYAAAEGLLRYVGHDRGVPEYFPKGNQKRSQAIGFIPQVSHTFAYYEVDYGVMNEFQVAITESTTSAHFNGTAVNAGGYALLCINELTQLGLERARTARDAVKLMGALAEQYGFYGEDNSINNGGESLMVTDPNEAFIFHVTADPTGASAIWVAQRVPDDHIAVVANMFVIRDVDLADSRNFLGSTKMFDIAVAHGLWKRGTSFDFTAIFSNGEYENKYYSGRRVWRAYDLLAPSLQLPAQYRDLRYNGPYPVTLKPDRKIGVQDLMAVFRDYLEGTDFDMTKGLAAGPFGTPVRYHAGPAEQILTKSDSYPWERTISIYRTVVSYILQVRGWLPNEVGGMVWIGPHAAHGTCYYPFPIGMTELPSTHGSGSMGTLNKGLLPGSAFFAHQFVENIAQLNFGLMIRDIRARQQMLEDASRTMQIQAEQIFVKSTNATAMTQAFINNAHAVVLSWWKLADELLLKYADGFVNDPQPGSPLGYPLEWLQRIGLQGQGIASDASITSAAFALPPHWWSTLSVGVVGMLIGGFSSWMITRQSTSPSRRHVKVSDGNESPSSSLLAGSLYHDSCWRL